MLYFIMDIACLLYASNIEAYLPPKFWGFSKNPEKDHRNVFALLNVSVRFMKVRYFKLQLFKVAVFILIYSFFCVIWQQNGFSHFVIGDILSVDLIGCIGSPQSPFDVDSYAFQPDSDRTVICSAWHLKYVSNEGIKD